MISAMPFVFILDLLLGHHLQTLQYINNIIHPPPIDVCKK